MTDDASYDHLDGAMFIRLVGCLAVIVAASFVMTRQWLRRHGEKRDTSAREQLAAALVFGLVSVYGTLGGFKYLGSFLNLRDIGPLIGGLYFGPVTGALAGLIGAAHRLWMGHLTMFDAGDSTLPCAFATFVAGWVGGLARRLVGTRMPRLIEAVALGLFMSVLHIGIVFAYDYQTGVNFFSRVWVLWMTFYALAMASYVHAARYLARGRDIEHQARLMEQELTIARDIQRGILPNVFPPFPNRPEIDLHAHLAPAREVGGDFYDFFMIDQRRLLVLVGDVSGKGVPAALFMAVTRTMLRSKDWRGRALGDVVAEVNNELSAENNEAMFVTLFGAAVDLETGAVEYVNCGHNPPLVRRLRPAASGRNTDWVRDPVGLVLGVMPDFAFEGGCARLEAGDSLFLYTDGVTEAERAGGAQYGEERLEALLSGPAGKERARGLCDAVVRDVERFVEGAPPSDDLTLLCLRYLGAGDA